MANAHPTLQRLHADLTAITGRPPFWVRWTGGGFEALWSHGCTVGVGGAPSIPAFWHGYPLKALSGGGIMAPKIPPDAYQPGYGDAGLSKAASSALLSTAGASAVAAAGGTATAGAAAVTGATASLLSAAGATALVPGAGWIAAGGLLAAAGIVALVGHFRGRGRKDAIAYAASLGEGGKAFAAEYASNADKSDASIQRQVVSLQGRIAANRAKTGGLLQGHRDVRNAVLVDRLNANLIILQGRASPTAPAIAGEPATTQVQAAQSTWTPGQIALGVAGAVAAAGAVYVIAKGAA